MLESWAGFCCYCVLLCSWEHLSMPVGTGNRITTAFGSFPGDF